VNVVVISDTHIKRGWKRRIPDSAYRRLKRADVILHAGDIAIPEVLDDLGRFAPVHAVAGNNDAELAGMLPEELRIDLDGVRVGVIHDSGPAPGRFNRLTKRFPDCALVVFGHSHIPLLETTDGRMFLNPGSPTDKRRQPNFTLATMKIESGRVLRPAIVALDA
jgi:uncharacterized protein